MIPFHLITFWRTKFVIYPCDSWLNLCISRVSGCQFLSPPSSYNLLVGDHSFRFLRTSRVCPAVWALDREWAMQDKLDTVTSYRKLASKR